MYQILIDLHPEGTAVEHSDNAKVIPFDPATPDATREGALRAIDELLGLVKSGQYVAPMSEAAAAAQEPAEAEPTTIVEPEPEPTAVAPAPDIAPSPLGEPEAGA